MGTVYWLLMIGPAVNLAMKFFSWPLMPSRWIDVFNALGANGTSERPDAGRSRRA